MKIQFDRDFCRDLSKSETREWLVTNGMGGYASGTIAGLLTRRYHGLLIAATQPPVGRMLMLAKLDEICRYGDGLYALSTNRWNDGTIEPKGYRQIVQFALEGTLPVWQFEIGDARLEKRVWMEDRANTTYIRYHLLQGSQPLSLTLNAWVNYRDHQGNTQAHDWPAVIAPTRRGVRIQAQPDAVPLYLFSDAGEVRLAHQWLEAINLAVEQYRGLEDTEQHFHAATLEVVLQAGDSLTVAASTEANPRLDGRLDGAIALQQRQAYERKILSIWPTQNQAPDWIGQLVLAADQFIVDRASPADPDGKTVIAGYHWFCDWGRDTMIALPGLTLVTGRYDVARSILLTFARYVDQGLLPNRFPDMGEVPVYNTVDATLWYFQAIRAYYDATQDDDLLQQLLPVLASIVDWHQRGTYYNIQVDSEDGLLYAGEAGVQLTWMDAKMEDWVVTPRIGKPVEVNALWYGALRSLAAFARCLGQSGDLYDQMADRVAASFARFWNADAGYCYDVLDGPDGDDPSLRPNQIFAVSLPHSPLNAEQQRRVVEICEQQLLTPYGLRSLGPAHSNYQGHYGGSLRQRDGAYHQGTVWGWLLGPFTSAHLRVFNDPDRALTFLQPFGHHLTEHGLGSISEIFDGDHPFAPRGCIAQAWSVGETLRAWSQISNLENPIRL